MKAKKVLAFLMSLALVLGCAACTNTSSNNPGGNSEGANNPAANTGNETPAGGIQAGTSNESLTVSTDTVGVESYVLPSITFAAGDNPTTLTPYLTKSSMNTVFYEMYEKLFITDNDDGHMIPVLADATKGGNNPDGIMGYDHEPGSSDYTVYIYDYITDSAGNNITSSDVKFSFQKAYEGGETSSWDVLLPIEDRIECVDDYTIVFHFANEITKVQVLENIWAKCHIFSEKAFQDSPSQFSTDACGTGPYVLESFTSDSQIVLVKRDDFWQTNEDLLVYTQLANVEKITMEIITENAQKVMGLQTGELNYVDSLNYSFSSDFGEGGANSDRYNRYISLGTSCYNMIPNCDESSICNDINMRLAIFYALDNEGICAMLGEGTSEPVSAVGNHTQLDYVSDFETWDNYNTNPNAADVEKYKELAGYTDQTIRLIANSNNKSLAEIVLNILLNTGFNVELQVLDRAVYLDVLADCTAWDITFVNAAGDYQVFAWSVAMDTANTAHGRTRNFIDDANYQEMLQNVMTISGHTEENMKAYWQYTVDNAYIKGLYSATTTHILPENMSTLAMLGVYVLPGACVYSGPIA